MNDSKLLDEVKTLINTYGLGSCLAAITEYIECIEDEQQDLRLDRLSNHMSRAADMCEELRGDKYR